MTDGKANQYKKKSSVYFDGVARRNRVIHEPAECYRFVTVKLAALKGGRLLDAGCGAGGMLSEINRKFPGRFSLCGMDISKKSLEAARARCGSFAQLAYGDAEGMPYENDTFDGILCMHSFHHYPAPAAALGEMHRVLRPGGRLILVDNDYPLPARLRWNLLFLLLDHPTGDIRFYSRNKLGKMAEQAGFSVVSACHIAHHSQYLECVKPA